MSNTQVDPCTRAQNRIQSNSICATAFNSLISAGDNNDITLTQFDALLDTVCEATCHSAIVDYFSDCKAEIVSL